MSLAGLWKFLSDVLAASGAAAAASILFGVLILIGIGWLIKYNMQTKLKIRETQSQLDREKFIAEREHIKKLESDGDEWRAFLNNHMEHFVEEQRNTTNALQMMTENHSKISAKQIENLTLLNQKIDGLDDDHKAIKSRLDDVWKQG